MNIDDKPIYIPVKLQKISAELEERILRKRRIAMILKPKSKSFLDVLKSWF